MEKKGKLIFTTNFDNKIFAVITHDINSLRVSVNFYIITLSGEMSDIITIPRQDIYKKKNPLDFFYDLNLDLSFDDIEKIKNEVCELLRNSKNHETLQEKATLSELHQKVSNFIRQSAEDLQDNVDTEIFIREGHGYMNSDAMETFVSEYKFLGYKRLEILKRLKIMGVLKNAKNRPYDVLVSIENNKRRYYKIELAPEENETVNEEECETIDSQSI